MLLLALAAAFYYHQHVAKTKVKQLIADAVRDSKKGEYESSIFKLTQAIAIDPYNETLYSRRAVALNKIGEHPEKIIADANEAIKINPRRGYNYSMRALAELQLGRLDEAISDLNIALSSSPSASAHTNLGVCYLEKNEIERALQEFSLAVKEKLDALAFNNRSCAYYRQKHYDLAIADADKALSLNSKMLSAYVIRALCYLKLGQRPEAQADLSQADLLTPQSAYEYDSRAMDIQRATDSQLHGEMAQAEFVSIALAGSFSEELLLASKLEDAGVPVVFQSRMLSGLPGTGYQGSDILVPRTLTEKAMSVIAEARGQALPAPDREVEVIKEKIGPKRGLFQYSLLTLILVVWTASILLFLNMVSLSKNTKDYGWPFISHIEYKGKIYFVDETGLALNIIMALGILLAVGKVCEKFVRRKRKSF
jgi:tetratricopeptide (TPR) repeat protein